MSQGAAIRRRKQWAINHRHLGPMDRPQYKTVSAAKSAKRLQAQMAKIKLMQGRKKS